MRKFPKYEKNELIKYLFDSKKSSYVNVAGHCSTGIDFGLCYPVSWKVELMIEHRDGKLPFYINLLRTYYYEVPS